MPLVLGACDGDSFSDEWKFSVTTTEQEAFPPGSFQEECAGETIDFYNHMGCLKFQEWNMITASVND